MLDQNISYHIICFCIIFCLSYYIVRKSNILHIYIYIMFIIIIISIIIITITITIIIVIIIIYYYYCYYYYLRILYGNRYRILHISYIYNCINPKNIEQYNPTKVGINCGSIFLRLLGSYYKYYNKLAFGVLFSSIMRYTH